MIVAFTQLAYPLWFTPTIVCLFCSKQTRKVCRKAASVLQDYNREIRQSCLTTCNDIILRCVEKICGVKKKKAQKTHLKIRASDFVHDSQSHCVQHNQIQLPLSSSLCANQLWPTFKREWLLFFFPSCFCRFFHSLVFTSFFFCLFKLCPCLISWTAPTYVIDPYGASQNPSSQR